MITRRDFNLALAATALSIGNRPAQTLSCARKPTTFRVEQDGWYVSNFGSDSNDGRSARTPLLTIAKLKQLYDGGVVFLERDSKFREELTALLDVTVMSYGRGEMPIIDGSEIIANASWSKTVGRTNVYEYAHTADFDAAGDKTAHRAWENDVRMRRVSSVAACDSTAGSFYAPTPTGGTDTIYVHASDSSDVSVNGKTYELTQRLWCVQLYNHQNQARISGLECRRNAHADGSIAVDGAVYRCIARDGRVHNAFIRGLAEDVDAIGMEPSTLGFSTSFIAFTDVTTPWANGQNCIFRRCRVLVEADALGASGNRHIDTNIGFYGHCGSDMQFGKFYFENCYVENCLTAYGGAQLDAAVYYKCNANNVHFGYSANAGVDDTGTGGAVVVLGGTINVTGIDGKAIDFGNDFQIPDLLEVRGLRIYKTGGGYGPIHVNIVGTTVRIRRCTIVVDHGGANADPLQNGAFTFEENVVYGPNDTLMMRLGYSGQAVPTLAADRNVYWCVADNGAHFQRGIPAGGFSDYLTVGAWSAATGQEAHSVAADPLFAGNTAQGDFTFAPGSPALAIGAGADYEGEEGDAELQVLWEQHRIAA